MNTPKMSISEIRARHPMPWRYIMAGTSVILQDALGRELPMFVMLNLICDLSHKIAQEPQNFAA